ncbi:MAG: tRNA preQ1(34) S-adenosylmethionine ribosyltransferase-isomerase QueA [Pseudomonadota bacterium]
MKLSDFDFELPEELIALRPVRPRPAARMLVAQNGGIEDRFFADLPDQLRAGDMLVFNDTKVIPARLFGERHRDTADGSGVAKIEVTLVRRDGDAEWTALAKPGRRLRSGDQVAFGNLNAKVIGKDGGEVALHFNRSGRELDRAIAETGAMPLPPYIAQRRPADAEDHQDYQTIFAEKSGAVAAPTASLHFDDDLLAMLSAKGIGMTRLTLHVGAGTFLPVTTEDVKDHKMHAEWGEIPPEAATAINAARKAGGRIIPAGTTALRLIESAADDQGQIQPWIGDTDIFITPGYRFRAADGLITNFHLPKSTLVMLVCALMGAKRIKEIYAHAIAQRYRFFSYGDGSLLLPG